MKEKRIRVGRMGGSLGDRNLRLVFFGSNCANGFLGPLAKGNAKGCRSFNALQKSLNQNRRTSLLPLRKFYDKEDDAERCTGGVCGDIPPET